ncbi:MAG: DUF1572 family protein [Cyclobacteriaceae bacterium]|nr:DUF1572 family protein [Cyclobacteriaceae bacterium HetDA_MAG_MS6]
MQEFVDDFKENIIYRLDESTRMVLKCLDELSEKDIWRRPNEESNSIGNLIVHLCGNITQYVISSLGDRPDQRDRDSEFSQDINVSKKELIQQLTATVEEARTIIGNSDSQVLLKKRGVQGFFFSGTGIAIHVMEHYSYHTGQIAFYTKLLKSKDLGFYDGMDLNAPNES